VSDLQKVTPLQAASEALRHFVVRSERPRENLLMQMADLIANLAVIADAEGLPFKDALGAATAMYRQDRQAYLKLREEKRIYLPGEVS
jgi:hypothetical protein